MKYEKRTNEVDAQRLLYPMTIEGPNGTVRGEKGDYLVTDGERQYFLSPADFLRDFKPKVEQPTAIPYPYPVYPPYTPPQPVNPWQPRWHYQPSVVYGSGASIMGSSGRLLSGVGTLAGGNGADTLTSGLTIGNGLNITANAGD